MTMFSSYAYILVSIKTDFKVFKNNYVSFSVDESIGSIDFTTSLDLHEESLDSKDGLKHLVEKMENQEERGEDISKMIEVSPKGTV